MPATKKSRLTKQVLKILEDDKIRDDYFYSVMAIADQKARADCWIDEARAEGMEKGRLEGLLQTAKNLKSEGLDVSAISRVTGISIDDIRRL